MAKNSELLEKIHSQKKAHKSRDEYPFDTFHKKIAIIEKLLNKNEELMSTSLDLLREARSQFIIAVITAFEVYFKDLLIMTFNKCNPEIIMTNCKKIKMEQKFAFAEIVAFYEQKIKVEDIIRVMNNFQNIENVFDVFSTLSGITMKNEIIKSENGLEKDIFGITKDVFANVINLLSLRHILTHEINKDIEIKKTECSEWSNSLIVFVFAFNDIYHNKFVNVNLKKIRKRKANNGFNLDWWAFASLPVIAL